MLVIAIILISIAVLLGAYLLSFVLKDKNPPKAIAIAHGICAVLGIFVLLTYALTTQEHHKHWDSLIIFSIAAVIGLYLFSRDIRHKDVPKSVAIVHATIALSGFVWILIHVFNLM
jgi:uncharacterized membrane protein